MLQWKTSTASGNGTTKNRPPTPISAPLRRSLQLHRHAEVNNVNLIGSDMIILVGMIERWVVDLVILMNSLMVGIWVGHLEATEVVHLLGGGYLFGLPVGFVADSIGATIGAGAAFLLGRTIGRSFVISKLKDYPQFRAVAIAIRRSGFRIVLLLRLVPLLPFNMLNYLLSVTPVSIGHYLLASWLGMMPITFALVYVGTTLKDLSDVTHGWGEFSKTRWAPLVFGLVASGMMGSGKTTVGKILSEALGYSFYDCNALIEQAVGGTTVAKIFKLHGENFIKDNEVLQAVFESIIEDMRLNKLKEQNNCKENEEEEDPI